MHYTVALALTGTLLLTGCSIKQNITPVADLETKEVCIIQNPQVTNNFLPAYKSALEAKNYSVIIKDSNDTITVCPVTSTYTANWRWDLALYLAYANIKVFKQGVLSGEAVYDSLSGGANMAKFIKGEEKIKELEHQLYP